MPGTRPGMTSLDRTPYSIGCILNQTLTMRSVVRAHTTSATGCMSIAKVSRNFEVMM
jgi:hypothetical protein